MVAQPDARRATTRGSLLLVLGLAWGGVEIEVEVEVELEVEGEVERGGTRSKRLNRSTAMPRVMKPRPVRSQARKVRSEAR